MENSSVVISEIARDDKPIDLYTWATPNGRKVSIMLEELGLDYNVLPIDITKGEQHDSAFVSFSPNNKIPAIVDHETGSKMMVEEKKKIIIETRPPYNDDNVNESKIDNGKTNEIKDTGKVIADSS